MASFCSVFRDRFKSRLKRYPAIGFKEHSYSHLTGLAWRDEAHIMLEMNVIRNTTVKDQFEIIIQQNQNADSGFAIWIRPIIYKQATIAKFIFYRDFE